MRTGKERLLAEVRAIRRTTQMTVERSQRLCDRTSELTAEVARVTSAEKPRNRALVNRFWDHVSATRHPDGAEDDD